MDARTIRLRLSGHGDLTAHRDGRYSLRLVRPAEEGYHTPSLWRVIEREIPGAVLSLCRTRRAADRYFEIHEVVFSLGPGTELHSCVVTCNRHMEGNADEVATGDKAERPTAAMLDLQGKRPGPLEGPGRVSPEGVVGRAEQGRAA